MHHFLFKKGLTRFVNAKSVYVFFGMDQKTKDLHDGVEALTEQVSISLKRVDGGSLDRVSCKSTEPDGFFDNIFVVDIGIPESILAMMPVASKFHLDRKGLGRGGSGPGADYDTTDRYLTLGISHDLSKPLINSNVTQVAIPLRASVTRFWIFACADGSDLPDSQYSVHTTLTYSNQFSGNDSFSDIALKKVFENSDYAVFEF